MTDWKDKRVIVLGAARQGVALGHYLALHGAHVVMNDQKPSDQLEKAIQSFSGLDEQSAARVEWFFGSHPFSLLDGTDMVCVSGGIALDLPFIQEARRKGIPLSNDSQIFLEECPCKTIGITGSAGKTTTTSLVGKIADTAVSSNPSRRTLYRKVWVGGNIGSPLLAVVDEMGKNDLAVMELSSFQLELMTRSVDIACVLNITPNHLDRHATMEAYIAAKSRILEYQTEQDAAVLGCDDPGAWRLLEKVHGKKYSFGRAKPPVGMQGAYIESDWVCLWDGTSAVRVLRQAEIPLLGWHNVENVLAAFAISQAVGLPLRAMREAIISFSGVPHRLEWVHFWKGADWYNDSIATAPERVMAAIHSFESPADIQRPIVLLAGGRDKNLPWSELADLIHARVDHLILFGEAAEKIAAVVGNSKPEARPYTIDMCPGLEQAVKVAARIVEPGDIVLLSPGGTSFDEFRDFEERGEAFKRWVLDLSCM
ncbi:MAG: UDP-N-acetylmuramoylalanine--D-glutamate ligase [Chloroflexi bacterium RBG_13_50_21]|nr:MAG: UDP-N-acetylmuramoylalanine--D-glutamate ligase [Chloroflexi bacterium RBG_13_50_21]